MHHLHCSIINKKPAISVLAVLILLVTAAWPRISGAVATNLSLQSPTNRTIELEPNVNAQQWAQMNDLNDAEQRDQSDGSTLLNFHMPDDKWAQQSRDLCSMPGVSGCGTNHCREFLAPSTSSKEVDFSGRVSNISGGPVAGAKIMLMPQAPQVSEFIADKPEEDESDEQSINLNLRPGKRRCAYDQGTGLGPGMANADGSGGFDLALPGGDSFDPGCWELKAGNACEAQSIPTRSLMPESEPNRILALLPGTADGDGKAARDTANALGLAVGVSVIDVVPLASLNSTLVRFEAGSGGTGSKAAAIALRVDPRVETAQPEYRYRTNAIDSGDPYGWMNYGAKQIGAQRMQAIATGIGVTVAVIDTGIDKGHPELASRVVAEHDVSGFGMSPDRHGTAIAGIIAAESGNGVGSYGVAPGTKILAIKACEPESDTGISSRCWSSTIAKALDKALTSDAAIINMSLGGPEDALVARLLDKAAEQGVLVLASAGNDGPDAPPPFPASHPAVMAITAVDAHNKPYTRAVRGDFIDVAAPGVEIAVPAPGETYPAQLTGTSMATAYVAGAAALLLSIHPDATANSVRASLQDSAINPVGNTRDMVYGHGRIDVCAAADRIAANQVTCPAANIP